MKEWVRVSKRRRCPICDHADWCLIAVDGRAAICPRVESDKRAGEGGWLHRLGEGRVERNWTRRPRGIVIPKRSKPRPDLWKLIRRYQALAEREVVA